MSLIIAIKEKDNVVVGCDSQVTYGEFKYSIDNNIFSKIWYVRNCPFAIMGLVGSLRDSQLLSTQEFIIDPYTILTDSISFDYVVNCLYTDIYNLFDENMRIGIDQDGVKSNEIEDIIMFAYGDEAYVIYPDGGVRTIEDYLVIGSGSEIAEGILMGNKCKPSKERITEAIQACSENSLHIDNNIVIMNTNKYDDKDEDEEKMKDDK